MSDVQRGNEESLLRDQGEGAGERLRGGEGGGGAHGDESFTLGGARGRDAERGEYYEPDEERDREQGGGGDYGGKAGSDGDTDGESDR